MYVDSQYYISPVSTMVLHGSGMICIDPFHDSLLVCKDFFGFFYPPLAYTEVHNIATTVADIL